MRAFWRGAALGAICGVLLTLAVGTAATLAVVRGGLVVSVDGDALASAVAEQVRSGARASLPAAWEQLSGDLPDRAAAAVSQRLSQVHIRIGTIRAPLPPDARIAIVQFVRATAVDLLRQGPPPAARAWADAAADRLAADAGSALRRAMSGRTIPARIGPLSLRVRVIIQEPGQGVRAN